MAARTFPNRYRSPSIFFVRSAVSTGVSNNDTFLDRTTHGSSRPGSVRWWIPLVAATGGLLALVLGAAAMVSGVVNSTLGAVG